MKKRHLDFLLKFYKPKSRQLNLISDCRVISNHIQRQIEKF
jgi:hypothetical protein